MIVLLLIQYFSLCAKRETSSHLTGVETVVLDEADMLLGTFRGEVDGLLSKLATTKGGHLQHVFCAATLPVEGAKAAGEYLRKKFPRAAMAQTKNIHQTSAMVQVNHLTIDLAPLVEECEL